MVANCIERSLYYYNIDICVYVHMNMCLFEYNVKIAHAQKRVCEICVSGHAVVRRARLPM